MSEAKQAPLPDLLDQVPDDIVLGIPGDEPMFPSYTNIPIGKLARLAAAELRRLAAIEAQRDALRAELKEATEAINDPAVNNLRTLAESIRMLSNQRDALLEALKELVAATDSDEWNPVSTIKARAAIKAAEEGK